MPQSLLSLLKSAHLGPVTPQLWLERAVKSSKKYPENTPAHKTYLIAPLGVTTGMFTSLSDHW
jgi:hypothetical protein